MRRIASFAFIAATLTLVLMSPAQAQAQNRSIQFYGLGPRVGASIQPDQFIFGGQVDFGDPLPQLNLLFPVVELGLGDNMTVASVGTDLLFRFRDRWGAWNPYLGGEVAAIFSSVDTGHGKDDTSTDMGLMGIFGVEKGINDNDRFAVEVKFQIIDAPDVKFLVAWTFGH